MTEQSNTTYVTDTYSKFIVFKYNFCVELSITVYNNIIIIIIGNDKFNMPSINNKDTTIV